MFITSGRCCSSPVACAMHVCFCRQYADQMRHEDQMRLHAGNMESMDNDIADDDEDDDEDDDDDDDDFLSENNRVPCGFYFWWKCNCSSTVFETHF